MRYQDRDDYDSTIFDLFYENESDKIFIESLITFIKENKYKTDCYHSMFYSKEFEEFRVAACDIWLLGLACSKKWSDMSQLMLEHSIDDLFREEQGRSKSVIGFQFYVCYRVLYTLKQMSHAAPHEIVCYNNPIFVSDHKFYQPLWIESNNERYAFRELSLGSSEQILHIGDISSGEELVLHGQDIPWADHIKEAYEQHCREITPAMIDEIPIITY